MTSLITKYITQRVLGETVKNNFGTEDPYFETVPATRLDGRPSGKTKKRRKALPSGISEHDGKILTKVKRRAYRLDMSLFNCCGLRFGWSSVIGIIPGIGDVIDAFMAIMVMRTCEQVEGGLPTDVKSKMYFNIVLDFGIGLVPFLGDIADAVFRANTRNAVELEKHLRAKGAKALKARGHAMPDIDPSDPDEFDRVLVEERGPPPRYTTDASPRDAGPGQHHDTTNGRTAATTPNSNGAKSKPQGGGWFSGFGSKKTPQHDIERNAGADGHQMDGPLPPPKSEVPQRKKSTLQKTRN